MAEPWCAGPTKLGNKEDGEWQRYLLLPGCATDVGRLLVCRDLDEYEARYGDEGRHGEPRR